jgi:hypothetical protein
MSSIDYLAYSNLERYLFDIVHDNFHKNHFIRAFDFFSIVLWKANRAKSYIAQRLREYSKSEKDLNTIVKRLTKALYNAPDHPNRLQILFSSWGFGLPMASAILTVLWPEDFTVYDYRVCDELNDFHQLGDWNNFENVWNGYCRYIDAVKSSVSQAVSLRDKDRILRGRSIAGQLQNDIRTGFNPHG